MHWLPVSFCSVIANICLNCPFSTAFSIASLCFLSKLRTRPLTSSRFTLGKTAFFWFQLGPTFQIPNQFIFGCNALNGLKFAVRARMEPDLIKKIKQTNKQKKITFTWNVLQVGGITLPHALLRKHFPLRGKHGQDGECQGCQGDRGQSLHLAGLKILHGCQDVILKQIMKIKMNEFPHCKLKCMCAQCVYNVQNHFYCKIQWLAKVLNPLEFIRFV